MKELHARKIIRLKGYYALGLTLMLRLKKLSTNTLLYGWRLCIQLKAVYQIIFSVDITRCFIPILLKIFRVKDSLKMLSMKDTVNKGLQGCNRINQSIF